MRSILLVCILTLTLSLTTQGQYQLPADRRYPSALVGLVLVGIWQAPTDQDTINEFISMYGSATSGDVQQWEFENSDLFTGGNYGTTRNLQKPVLFFDYVHAHRLETPTIPDYLIRRAIREGVNYEDFSLHYSVDTIINTSSISVTNTFWAGRLEAGSTSSPTGYGERLDNYPDVFRGFNNGGAFFVWAMLPFTDIYVTLQQNGIGGSGLIVEYPSAVDMNNNFAVTQWSQATILEDTTNNFSQSGRIRIAFPPNWKYAALRPPHGFYYPYVANRGGVFALRIKCFGFSQRPLVSKVSTTPALEYLDGEPYVGVHHSGTAQAGGTNTITLAADASSSNSVYNGMLVKIVDGTGAGQVRLVTAYNGSTKVATVDQNWDIVPDNTSQYKIVRRVVRIRGWDPANDRNGDGWVDDTEFANLANPNATARFRHYARLIYTNAWSSVSAWDVPNVWNPTYRQYTAERIREWMQSGGYSGIEIDDAAINGLGRQWIGRHRAISPAVLQGGYIAEYPNGRVDQDDPTNKDWYAGYMQLIQTIKTIANPSWIGGNISNSNPLSNYWIANYLDPVFDYYRCEQAMQCGIAVDDYLGLSTRLANIYPAMAYRQKRHIIQGFVTGLTSSTNTRETWERKLTELTAMYYLVQIPGYSYMNWYNASYNYGSNNTIVNTNYDGFWKAGVPKNYAYRPRGLLSVDIGVPANFIPAGKRPMDVLYENDRGYVVKVGNSTSTVLSYPDVGAVPVVPTYIYILQQIDPRNFPYANGAQIPYDAVYAREYTKGLVLYRALAQYSGLWSGYENGNPVTVQLPGVYRKVNYDGTLSEPITQVEIRGYEGVILVKAAEASVPSIQLTMSVDKPKPKPLDVVTVSLEVSNIGKEAISHAEIRIPISGMTYEQGSLTPQEFTVDTSNPDTLKITIPTLGAGSKVALQFRLVVR
jgi:hypothetical protein